MLEVERGAPTRVAFRFERALDDPRIVLWVQVPGGFAQVPPPLWPLLPAGALLVVRDRPALARATQVVLVEGEKCAQALIEAGVIATTAMHGANAPVEKTDWSPLANKMCSFGPIAILRAGATPPTPQRLHSPPVPHAVTFCIRPRRRLRAGMLPMRSGRVLMLHSF